MYVLNVHPLYCWPTMTMVHVIDRPLVHINTHNSYNVCSMQEHSATTVAVVMHTACSLVFNSTFNTDRK